MAERLNRQWRLASRPLGMLEESDFSWHEEPIAAPAQGEVLVRNVYLSLDPANRGWVTERATYVEPVALGEVMRGLAIGVVEESKNPAFSVGDGLRCEYLRTMSRELCPSSSLIVKRSARFIT